MFFLRSVKLKYSLWICVSFVSSVAALGRDGQAVMSVFIIAIVLVMACMLMKVCWDYHSQGHQEPCYTVPQHYYEPSPNRAHQKGPSYKGRLVYERPANHGEEKKNIDALRLDNPPKYNSMCFRLPYYFTTPTGQPTRQRTRHTVEEPANAETSAKRGVVQNYNNSYEYNNDNGQNSTKLDPSPHPYWRRRYSTGRCCSDDVCDAHALWEEKRRSIRVKAIRAKLRARMETERSKRGKRVFKRMTTISASSTRQDRIGPATRHKRTYSHRGVRNYDHAKTSSRRIRPPAEESNSQVDVFSQRRETPCRDVFQTPQRIPADDDSGNFSGSMIHAYSEPVPFRQTDDCPSSQGTARLNSKSGNISYRGKRRDRRQAPKHVRFEIDPIMSDGEPKARRDLYWREARARRNPYWREPIAARRDLSPNRNISYDEYDGDSNCNRAHCSYQKTTNVNQVEKRIVNRKHPRSCSPDKEEPVPDYNGTITPDSKPAPQCLRRRSPLDSNVRVQKYASPPPCQDDGRDPNYRDGFSMVKYQTPAPGCHRRELSPPDIFCTEQSLLVLAPPSEDDFYDDILSFRNS